MDPVFLAKETRYAIFLVVNELLKKIQVSTFLKGRRVAVKIIHVYYPKVLTCLLDVINFLRCHKQSHNFVCIPRYANMSVKHAIKRFSIIQCITSKRHR